MIGLPPHEKSEVLGCLHVRDAFGRVFQTIDRQKTTSGRVHATTRDASGRIIGTATTQPTSGGSLQTTYRDANGRMSGSAST